jgi:hypothetical protein
MDTCKVDKQLDSNPCFPINKIHIQGCDWLYREILEGRRSWILTWLFKKFIESEKQFVWWEKHIPTDWHVVISLLFEITPNSSTFEANRMHVGASNSGSIHFKEFLA